MGNIELEHGRERSNAFVNVTKMSLVNANPENSLSHTMCYTTDISVPEDHSLNYVFDVAFRRWVTSGARSSLQ